MYVYLLCTQSIQISKTKLLVKMASESERFCKLQEIIKNKDLWGIVKQIRHGLFREVEKITGPSVLDAWNYFPPLRVGK